MNWVAFGVRLAMVGKSSTDFVYAANPHQFRRMWKWLMECLHYDAAVMLPYCIRRGGATFDWSEYADAARLVFRGRWEHLKTARLYAVEGVALRQDVSESLATKQAVWIWGRKFLEITMKLQATPQ